MGTLKSVAVREKRMSQDPLVANQLKTIERPFSVDVLENKLFRQQLNVSANACLQIVFGSVLFFVYFKEEKLLYATHSVAPFERLERHLRRLSNRNSQLSNEAIAQLRRQYRSNSYLHAGIPSEYRGILWLAAQNYLNAEETATLIRRITREVFESILSLPDASSQYRFVQQTEKLPEFCLFDLDLHIQHCRRRLQAWGNFTSRLESSYQRLYLVTESKKNITNLTTEQNETICKLLRGFNFRQIGAMLDRDELVVAKILYPSIVNKTIVIRNPKPPHDLLPSIPEKDVFAQQAALVDDVPTTASSYRTNSSSKETLQIIDKSWKIACVDDNREILAEIQKILDNNLFEVLAIGEPMSAFAQLIEYRPDLILLDAQMPDLNGYELCSLLRKHQNFKNTQIIMLVRDLGLIDLTKLKLVGATDYLSKPFTQVKLLNTIFRYIQ